MSGYKVDKKDLAYRASLWSNFLFKERCTKGGKLKRSVVSLNNGIHKHTKSKPNEGEHFAKEIYSRMYEKPKLIDSPVPWAMEAHTIASGSKDFDQLAELVNDDADFSAMATAEILTEITPELVKIFKQSKSKQQNKSKQQKEQKEQVARSIRLAIQNVNNKISPKIKDTKEGLAIFGYGTSSADKDKSTDRSDLVTIMYHNRTVKDIMHKAGSLLEIVDSLPSADVNAKSNIDKIGIGDDLPNVLFKEYINLADASTEDIFYKKYIDKELLQFETKGTSEKGRGNVFVLLDESGSMGGLPNELARAIAAAMAMIAMKHDRYYHAVTFDGSIGDIYKIHGKSRSALMKKRYRDKEFKECSPEKAIVDLASSFSGGGTDFNQPLNYALDNGALEKNADIVFITDGYCSICQTVLDKISKARKQGLRVFTLLMNTCKTELIESISDKIIDITQLANSLEKEDTKELADVISDSTKIV